MLRRSSIAGANQAFFHLPQLFLGGILTRYHIGVDIGGTFTDCAVMDDTGKIVTIAKSSTDHKNPENGVLNVLSAAAQNIGMTRPDLLKNCRFLIHGCTVATNAMVERNGVPTALITTKGHEDAIYIGKVIQKVAGLSNKRSSTNPI